MKITKYGHACILVETGDAHILVDPGMWNTPPQADVIDAILITHEHQDHCDVDQVKALIAKHGGVRIITHAAVGKNLSEAGITPELLESGAGVDVKGVSVESYGTEHAHIYGGVSPCRNTGYLIGNELFVPGDALHDVPPQGVRILALPTGGAWMRLSEAIDYAKAVKPKTVFPVHDAMYIEEYRKGLVTRLVGGMLEPEGIAFVDMPPGSSHEF